MGNKNKYLTIITLVAVIFGATGLIFCKKDKTDKISKKQKKGRAMNTRKAAVGYQAPDFTLRDQAGNFHTLSKMSGKKVVIYFYPKDDTPGCTKQACSLRDGFADLKAADITIWGISYDSPESHQEFKKKYALPFPLLSDADKSVSKLYDADGWFMPSRVTILIDKDGVVIDILKDIDVSSHADQIIKAFAS